MRITHEIPPGVLGNIENIQQNIKTKKTPEPQNIEIRRQQIKNSSFKSQLINIQNDIEVIQNNVSNMQNEKITLQDVIQNFSRLRKAYQELLSQNTNPDSENKLAIEIKKLRKELNQQLAKLNTKGESIFRKVANPEVKLKLDDIKLAEKTLNSALSELNNNIKSEEKNLAVLQTKRENLIAQENAGDKSLNVEMFLKNLKNNLNNQINFNFSKNETESLAQLLIEQI